MHPADRPVGTRGQEPRKGIVLVDAQLVALPLLLRTFGQQPVEKRKEMRRYSPALLGKVAEIAGQNGWARYSGAYRKTYSPPASTNSPASRSQQ